jgi:exodeoxyribonuclease VII large subunit
VASRTDDLLASESGDTGILSIADLYDEVDDALARTFPRSRQLWVRGEIHNVSDQPRTGHCYLDLIDPETSGQRQAPVLRVKCWRSTWGPLKGTLAREGIELAPGMVVVLRGTLDFYRARAEVGFILAEIDVTALLGRLAAERAALLRTLAAEGLLDRNRKLRVPAVPLRIGLVASSGTEGYRDFLGQLEGSGFSFHVSVASATVQGADAPRAIARAIGKLADRAAEFDLVVVVRGGGSKADLAAFDTERVARAVATCPLPVWTGIGHTGDESVADLLANRCCITPTECGRELSTLVAQWWRERVASPAERLRARSVEALSAAEQRDHAARVRLTVTARHLLSAQSDRLLARARTTARLAPLVVDEARARVASRATRLAPLSAGHLARAAERTESWRRLLAAYDPDRQLERGYSLTLSGDGSVVRSVEGLAPGAVLTTRFSDGSARSVVESVAAGNDEEKA